MNYTINVFNLPTKGDLENKYKAFKNYRNLGGELIDFNTTDLNLDLEHPVSINALYSYDGSVNLILNDNKNIPRLINSRFSVTELGKYEIVDRQGTYDTNIYDSGDNFDIETSLYKRTISIPTLDFLGVKSGGNLSVGNYHFYFKLLDSDNNATDFIAESGLVSVFIGTHPLGIKGGFRDENSNKLVRFKLSNIDSAYPYILVYYTRATSDIHQNSIKEVKKIDKQFVINNSGICNIVITGLEQTEDSTLELLNILYHTVSSAKTQAICLNRLFLGNLNKQSINNIDLLDLALRFIIKPDYKNYNPDIDQNYSISNIKESYYDPEFIYNTVGYWPEEYYRFGVVFILNDNSLTNVFNIRGQLNLTSKSEYIEKSVRKNNIREYIKYDDINYKLIDSLNLENCAGVISIEDESLDNFSILGIKIELQKEDEVIEELKKLGIKGLFFVRQARIPNILCQALSISTDFESNVPVLKTKNGTLNSINDYSETQEEKYVVERFIDNDKYLNETTTERLYIFDSARDNAAICPEYTLNQAFFNSYFTGEQMIVKESKTLPKNSWLTSSYIHFYNLEFENIDNVISTLSRVIGIPDATSLIALDEFNKFSSQAGLPEDPTKFSFIEHENKVTEANNLVRGNFSPFIGFDKEFPTNKLLNISLNRNTTSELLLQIRALDNSVFLAISYRYSLDLLNNIPVLYRGDCYIGLYTQRLNRNFNSNSAPYNDIIVDNECFKNLRYINKVIDSNSALKINIGDLNAIKLGMWVTSTFRSNINLCVRSVDESNTEEVLKTGHGRGFFPLFGMVKEGNYKTPEANCFNSGFLVGLSERWNFSQPNVPYLKNEFSNRILYSNINVTDAFENGFRVFESTNFRDYPKTYGSITKLIECFGNLLCVFEHGICLISVNERAVAAEGDGGNVFINTNNVLPDNPLIISDSYGSLWIDSIVKTDKFIYGIDTVSKKIWKTNGQEFECISELKVQEFLNNNIKLHENETEHIGIRNVKSFFNRSKGDVMFTVHNNNIIWNLCYNENLNTFITFYSWIPQIFECIDNIPISFNYEDSKLIIDETNKSNNLLWKHGFGELLSNTNDTIKPTHWYGKQHSFEFEFVVVDDPSTHKIFDNLEIVANKAEPESFHYEVVGECYNFVNDKPNMYYRLERLKENSLDKFYDKNYTNITPKQNTKSFMLASTDNELYNFNNVIEDYYVYNTTDAENPEYRNITGGELVKYNKKNELRLNHHVKANILKEEESSYSILSTNCRYLEDRWKVQISPVKLYASNENDWDDGIPPINIEPDNWKLIDEIDLKDRYIKIKLRYSGKELVIIDLIKTIYRISYT